jgi:hypothetical protein
MAILKIIQIGFNRHCVPVFSYLKLLSHLTIFQKNNGVSQKSDEE